MGIQGLLPFLKKASRTASIKEFKGCTVAIDSYCWLHRGAFACAEKLALGEKTDQYVYYCMKYINNLLSYGIRPIMVFDGCRLPSKKEVERARRERRELNRKKAAQLLREGKRSEARDCLAQCIDITPQMALELMNACHEKGVDCIVAPYEADAQLAYLNKIGVAQVVITEDSDLILFGCEKIMFKMDVAGNGILIEKNDLNNALQLPLEVFTFDKFRYICILSGCDYLPNLSGVGLAKALKLFKLSRQNDLKQIIRRMPSILKMSTLTVPDDYVENFIRANNTFLYQLVYDPLKRKLIPLNPYPADMDPSGMDYAGPYISDEKALQIALGNINVNTGERIADFDPDHHRAKTTSWSQDPVELQAQSIWMPGVSPSIFQTNNKHLTDDCVNIDRPSTKGKEVIIKGPVLKDRSRPTQKRIRQVSEEGEKFDDQDLVKLYSEHDLNGDLLAQCKGQQMPVSLDNSFGKMENTLTIKRPKVSEDVQDEDQNGNFAGANLTESPNENAILTEVSNTGNCTFESIVNCVADGLSKLPSPEKVCTLGKENNSPARFEQQTISPATSTRCRNVFAIDRNAAKQSRFSLNAPRVDQDVAPVTSRFFIASIPRKETEFFKELKKGHSSGHTIGKFGWKETPDENSEEDDEEEPEKEFEAEEIIKENDQKRGGALTSNPHNNFKFGSLSLFKSQFDSRRTLENSFTSNTDLSSSMISTSQKQNLKSCSSSCSTLSQSSNISQKSVSMLSKDDSDCLSEDPFENLTRSSSSSNVKDDDGSLATLGTPSKLTNNSLFKRFSHDQRLSLDLQSSRIDELDLTNDAPNDKMSQSFSQDCDANEMLESPTLKSSNTKAFSTKGCRASGLMKTKTKSRKSVLSDGCKQSSLSQYFQSTFALDKKSVAKLAPSAQKPL